jgi:hypothetical protein
MVCFRYISVNTLHKGDDDDDDDNNSCIRSGHAAGIGKIEFAY